MPPLPASGCVRYDPGAAHGNGHRQGSSPQDGAGGVPHLTHLQKTRKKKKKKHDPITSPRFALILAILIVTSA